MSQPTPNEPIKPEEERRPMTPEEEAALVEYQKEYDKQHAQIRSYDDLIKAKENEDKRNDINRWLNRLLERNSMLHAQEYKDPDIVDRLGNRSDFYTEIWDNMKYAPELYLNGDIDRQHKLLKIVASPEYDEKPASTVLYELDEFEKEQHSIENQKRMSPVK